MSRDRLVPIFKSRAGLPLRRGVSDGIPENYTGSIGRHRKAPNQDEIMDETNIEEGHLLDGEGNYDPSREDPSDSV